MSALKYVCAFVTLQNSCCIMDGVSLMGSQVRGNRRWGWGVRGKQFGVLWG